MGHKKNVSKYQQQQKMAQMKEAKKKRNRIILTTLAAVVLIATLITVLVVTLSGNSDGKTSTSKPADTSNPIKVAFEIKDYGKIVLDLYPNEAPISVENFVDYVEDGFYDGLKFHRVINGFMIQGGDPTGTGYGDSSLEKIKGEFSANNVENNLKFERGVIGMARSEDYNSASSQFFICHKTTSSLDGKYAAFGKVVEGLEVVDAIATCEKTSTIDAQGNKYVPASDVMLLAPT